MSKDKMMNGQNIEWTKYQMDKVSNWLNDEWT